MSDTWNTLQVACDARVSGRADSAAKLYDEVAPDFAYRRCSHRRRLLPFVLDEGDPYEDDYEPDSPEVQRAAWRREALTMDWLTWRNPLETSSFDELLREMYSASGISQMAMGENPAMSALARSRDSDVVEARIRSYVSAVQSQWYGVFPVGD